ncbi:homeobox-domain-containing protein [Conidiobolus coronatus NRRL 28638]|uniref:Homeobox-domain-containing protein n=1 Tax=Conidiobolus coronatus (strain ATCC 28846 / CBS 209.66 / NRRL 28638) TaxID=796925 RepID=A0A137NXL0_CONC2|nr:homeobox-domain-containing protein [Conidiobolus coronatus NRRL 28638]|eukprot:KXN67600.1 homeobox-domain-containing protein [Conidiobolus coronatus NRRL 28638]
MNLSHYSCQKRFDILNNVPFPYLPYSNHKNVHNNEEFNSGRLPSIDQLHILDIDTCKPVYYPPSPAESRFSTSSSPLLSSVSDSHTFQAPSSDHLNTSQTIDYGNKLRLHVGKRTCISDHQTSILNNFYRANKYPTHNEKVKLSKQLNLPERTIQIWFQNKRQNRGRKSKLN